VVRILSEKYGIQVRGGCSCAGTYGHYLLHIDKKWSHMIACQVESGDLSKKPGWVRLSLHPTMTNSELDYIVGAIKEIGIQGPTWAEEYYFDKASGEFFRKDGRDFTAFTTKDLFTFS
jgi:hypothetical protein